jgi:hypothetical protein
MIAVTVARISGAKLLVARKKPSRLTLTVIGGVQTGGEPERPLHLPPGRRVGEPRRLQREPFP